MRTEILNPFASVLTLDVLEIITPQTVPNPSGYGNINYSYFVEKQGHVTLYDNSELSRRLFMEAKPATVILFLYISRVLLKRDKDFIEIKPGATCEAINISLKTLYTAIHELTSYNVIMSKQGRNQYWINPEHLFSGNRIKYMNGIGPDHINVKAKIFASNY